MQSESQYSLKFRRSENPKREFFFGNRPIVIGTRAIGTGHVMNRLRSRATFIKPAPMRLLTIPMLLLLLAVSFVQAQEEFIQPPAKLLARFPFKLLTGGIITVKARLSNFPDTLT